MSFIRPEVRAKLWHWREVAFTTVFALLGVHLIGRGVDLSSPVFITLGAVLTVLSTGLLYVAIQRARFRPGDTAPGMVEVTERRISYLGPIEGAMVSIDALTRVEIRQSEAFGSVWVLYHTEGPSVVIPTAAAGSSILFDTFSALKGVDMELMIQATTDVAEHTKLIWQAAS